MNTLFSPADESIDQNARITIYVHLLMVMLIMADYTNCSLIIIIDSYLALKVIILIILFINIKLFGLKILLETIYADLRM